MGTAEVRRRQCISEEAQSAGSRDYVPTVFVYTVTVTERSPRQHGQTCAPGSTTTDPVPRQLRAEEAASCIASLDRMLVRPICSA
jgi:hypothetical protein